jgi:hypothetical protein
MSRFKFSRPSPALVVALVALFIVMGGSAVAATTLLVHTDNIANGAVTNHKIANGAVSNHKLADGAVGLAKLNASVRRALAKAGAPLGIVTGPKGSSGANGPQGSAGTGSNGKDGNNGNNGNNGRDGANPGVAVVNVPSIASSSGHNPNPDSGDAGDQGWYFSGNGTGGSASLANGELEVTGSGIDSATFQGGIGIAKAFANVPLSSLNALSYDYHVNQLHGSQAPIIHITVTGATQDSKFASGFANFVYMPPTPAGVGVSSQADTLNTAANWYSTGANGNNASAGAGTGNGSISDPVTLQALMTRNTNAKIGQISLDNGGSSGASGDFAAGADNLILGFTGGPFTRYDFGG